MQNIQNVNITIEYGEEDFKKILVELLKEEYIKYISLNEK